MKSTFDRLWPAPVYVSRLKLDTDSTRTRTRFLLMQSFYRLKIPREKWPSFDYSGPPADVKWIPKMKYTCNAFQPPSYDCLNETIEEWETRANELWREHVSEFRQWAGGIVQREEAAGELIKARRRRATQGGEITEQIKFEWTARKLSGLTYPEIARLAAPKTSCTPDLIKKAVRQILMEAGLDTKGRPGEAEKRRRLELEQPNVFALMAVSQVENLLEGLRRRILVTICRVALFTNLGILVQERPPAPEE